jgi:twitching motility protein PilU
MQTFDQAVFDLYKAGRISYDEALRNADSVNEVRLKIKLDKDGNGEDVTNDFGAGLEVEPDLQDVSVQQQQSKAASVSAGLALLTDDD